MTPIVIPRIPLPVRMGDVVFTWWPGKMCALTMKVTGGRAGHQEQICDDGPVPKVMAASQQMNRMNIWTWESRKYYFGQTKTEWCRFTPKDPLSPEKRRTLEYYFEEAINSFSYSRAELFFQGLDALRNWVMRIPYDSARAVFFRRMGDVQKSRVVCSKTVNIGLTRIDVFPAWSEYWNPADSLNKIFSSASWLLAEATDSFFPKDVAAREPPTVPVEPPAEMIPAGPAPVPPETMASADSRPETK